MAVVAVLAIVLVLTGCSAAAPPISPTAGVDELVVPTPNPDAEDFTTEVDNPWFPLRIGSSHRYRDDSAGGSEVVTTVVPGRSIAGVSTVGLRTSGGQDSAATSGTLDFYAQDADGNVWWFGRDGLWSAGEAGAQAGLIMAATPRRGDGYRQGLAPGVAEPYAELLRVGERLSTDLAAYDDVVVVESQDDVTDTSAGGRLVSYYAPGVGLIRRESDDSTVALELSEYDPQP